jgi:hypothetical protein
MSKTQKRKNAKKLQKIEKKTQEQPIQRKLSVSFNNFGMFFDEKPGANLIENLQL